MIFVGLLFLEIKYGSTLLVLTIFIDALKKCWNIYLRFNFLEKWKVPSQTSKFYRFKKGTVCFGSVTQFK